MQNSKTPRGQHNGDDFLNTIAKAWSMKEIILEISKLNLIRIEKVFTVED